MSTLTQLRTKLRNELKIDPNGKIWSDSDLTNKINVAYFQVQKDWNFEWRENQTNTTESTVVWTQDYALPSDFIRLRLLRYNWQQLYKVDYITLKRKLATFSSWQPNKYYLYGSNYWLDPIPDAVWTIDFDYLKKLSSY